MAIAAEQYPIRFRAEYPERLSRGLIFVKWLLVIPHFIAMMVLGIVAYLGIAVSWFAVIITGRYPKGIFDFVTGVLRWSTRMTAYVYLLTDAYPPFTLADEPSYPIHVEFDYPETIARWHPLLNWLLVFPVFIGFYVLGIVAYVAVFISWFAILITGRMPRALFDIISVFFNWQVRASGYILWLTGRYPPFVWG